MSESRLPQPRADRPASRRFAAFAVVAVLLVALLAWVGWSVWGDAGRRAGGGKSVASVGTSSASSTTAAPAGKAGGRDPAAPAPVDTPVALLSQYYEHGPEHAPPRDPSGAMQRRERGYTPPPNPLYLLRSKLTKDERDRPLREWVERYEAALRKADFGPFDVPREHVDFLQTAGANQRDGQVEMRVVPGPTLAPALQTCSLDTVTLLDVGRAMQFLSGDFFAIPWYRAGMLKAAEELKDVPAGDARARPFLALSEQTGKALWRTNAGWDVQEQRFRLARRLYPPLSAEARRSGVLLGVSFHYQGKSAESAKTILEVQAEHDQAGDLGALEKSDFDEMAWLSGLFLFQAGRYDEARPHWERCAKLGGNWAQQAARMLDQIENTKARRAQQSRENGQPKVAGQ